MSAIAYKFICANCDAAFEAPEVPEMSYGLFVLRTKDTDETAFLDAPNDAAFLESYEIVKNSSLVARRDSSAKGRIQQSVFTITCDKSDKNSVFEIGLMPKCPTCGSRNMLNWQPVIPTRDWPLPVVTHVFWEKKTPSEKVAAIDQAIQRVIG